MSRVLLVLVILSPTALCSVPPGLTAVGFTIHTGASPAPTGTISTGVGGMAYTFSGTAGSIVDADGDQTRYTWAETTPTSGVASGEIYWDPVECKYYWIRLTPSVQGPYPLTQP